MAELIAETRKGRQVVNLKAGVKLMVIRPVLPTADHVAVVGENRKLLVFPLDQIPEMGRGKGVRLQKYRDGGLADAKVFTLEEGLTWVDSSGRTWTVRREDLSEWMGARAQAGRMPPKGFPRNTRFGG
jgi:topoisomerase-4 subunit A